MGLGLILKKIKTLLRKVDGAPSIPLKIPSVAPFAPVKILQNDVFHADSAMEINRKRMLHIDSLGLNWSNCSLLDMGCGTGYFTEFFLKKGCSVHFADARSANVTEAAKLNPSAHPHLFDIEKDPIENLGFFDILFCYGLLYHLENPFRAILKMSQISKKMLLLETIVTDHELPINQLHPESPHRNQALHGIGSRPSPAYIIMALKNAGWRWIYTATEPPDHPDFKFEWKNNLEYSRNGNNLRCIFLASHTAIDNPALKQIS